VGKKGRGIFTYYRKFILFTVGIKRTRDKDKEKLSECYEKARESIIKAAAIGAYIVSDATVVALTKLLRELEKEDLNGNWVDDINRNYASVKECIEKIREYAKMDLQKR